MNRRQFLASNAAVVPALTANHRVSTLVAPGHWADSVVTASGRTAPISPGANGSVMEPGVYYCRHCQAGYFPDGPRLSEGHVSARFGRDDRRRFDVYEGDVKLLRAYEVHAGPNGWVIEDISADRLVGACPSCGQGPVCHLRYADVRVVRRQS